MKGSKYAIFVGKWQLNYFWIICREVILNFVDMISLLLWFIQVCSDLITHLNEIYGIVVSFGLLELTTTSRKF